jgi:type II secretory pathway component GspD/PulD (secretin)
VRLVEDEPKGKPDDKPAKVEPKVPTVPGNKKIAFSMDSKPWSGVFKWITDQTGKPVVSTFRPTGSFSFISPVGATYEIAEVIDIINEGLLAQKFYLLDNERNWLVVPADEKIDPSKLPTIKLEDLDKRGRNELVRLSLTLRTLQAADIAPEIKKVMGPFGEISVLEKFNQLYLQDTGANLRRIKKLLDDLENNDAGSANTSAYKCEYIRALEAERILKDQLGDSNKLIAPPSSGGGGGRDRGPSPAPATIDSKKLLFITSDERTNTLLFSGPVDKIAEAEALAKRIDQKRAGEDKVLVGEATIKTYTVPAGTAESWEKLLRETVKSPTLRISVLPGNQLMIHAYPQDHYDIAKTIAGNMETKSELKNITIDCGDREASEMAKTVATFLGETTKGGPLVEALTERNAILVRGTDEQIQLTRELIEAVNGKGGATGRTRIIELDGGSAPVLAEEIARLMSRMRKNPIEVTSPDRLRDEDARMREEQRRRERELRERERELREKEEGGKLGSPRELPISVQDEGGLVDPRDDKKKDPKQDDLPGSADKPVRIFASGNKLIMASDDPEALALVAQVINLYRKSPGKGDFTVLKLRNVSAVDAARALEEAFNGKPQQGGGGGGRGGRGGGAGGMLGGMMGGMLGGMLGGGGGVEDPDANRIRVVAYPATNSILVRATPLDMLLIRKLLSEALDPDFDDEEELIRTYILPLKHATASDVASLVREVFPEQGRGVPTPTRGGGGDPRAAMMQAMMGGGSPQPVTPVKQLSIGVDDRNNRLIVACPERMYKGIKKLVEDIDEASKDTARTIRVVRVDGLDPVLVQQVIDAVQGRRPTRGGTFGGIGGIGGIGGGGRGGFNQGGFNPGGDFGGGGGMMIPGGMGGGGRGGMMAPGGGGAGNFPAGGGGRGAGGGRGTGGGGRTGPRASLDPSPGSPDFFAQRVTDDPQQTANGLYDPQQDNRTSDQVVNPGVTGRPAGAPALDPKLTQIRYQDEKKPDEKLPDDKLPTVDSVRAPQSSVDIAPIESLGVIVIRGNTPADVQAVLDIIKILREQAEENDVKIQIIPLQNADATTVTAYLEEVYRRILVTPTGTRINPGARPGNIGAGLGTVTPSIGGVGTGATGIGGTTGGEGGSGIVLIPLPRVNSILVGAPKILMDKVVEKIQDFDQTPPNAVAPRVIQLKRASAARVAQLITNWAAGRYPREPGAVQTQVRVTWDDQTNKLFVQAAPADFAEIAKLVEELDNGKAAATNDLQIFDVRYALADEIANLIRLAIQQGYRPTNALTTQGIVTTPGAGQIGGQIGGQLGGQIGAQIGGQIGGAGLISPSTGLIGATAPNTKTIALRLINAAKGTSIESGNLDSVLLLADVRTNRIVVSAPEETMDLIKQLIKALDVPPAYKAEVNIFQLKNADATQLAFTLQQLFLGQAQGIGGGVTQGGLNIGAGANTAGLLGQIRPLAITFGDLQPEGLPLIDLRIGVDIRTNSIIVAGSRADLEIAEALISRLEDSKVEIRRNEVYRLMNSTAVDVANALNTFILQSIQVYRNAQQLTPFQDIEREVVVVPEPISNKLLISATPRYFPDIMRLVAELDAELPQVVIQVLIAEVNLNNTEEFGVEIGLQSPLLFQRSVTGLTTSGAGGPINFGFNNPALGLGNNNFVNPGSIGVQGLGSFGVGRVSPNSGVGGFVFSMSNDAFSVLIRALRTQGRADILSRPHVTAVDNQAATVAVGQSVPLLGGTTLGVGQTLQDIQYRDVGVILNVVPKIFPDGKVTMRVTPQISSIAQTTVNLGGGIQSPIFNQQIVDTTVTARDGETVVIGGLITRSTSKAENKIPWLGDLPYLGALFRYRQELKTKQELLIIMTPRIVRNRFERERILAEEGRRVDWILGDVVKTHGITGMDPLFTPAGPKVPGAPAPSVTDGSLPAPPVPLPVPSTPAPVLPPPGAMVPPLANPVPPTAPTPPPAASVPQANPMPVAAPSLGGTNVSEMFPNRDRPLAGLTTRPAGGTEDSQPVSLASLQPVPTSGGPPAPAANTAPVAVPGTPVAAPAAPTATPVPATQGKESERWRLFPRWR